MGERLKQFWGFFLHILSDQRGEVGELEGDDLNEGFTDEELVALGEKEAEPEKTVEGDAEAEPGQSATDETPGEVEGGEKPAVDDDSKRDTNAEKRINELYGKNKEFEERLELLKTDPEAYYQKFPDERPQSKEKTIDVTPKAPDPNDPFSILIKGGDFDGKTFREVYELDPDAAWQIAKNAEEERLYYRLENQIEYERRQEKDRQAQEAATIEERVKKDTANFLDTRAQELFEKPIDDLSEDDRGKVENVLQSVIDWQTEQANQGNFITNLDHAYKIMNFNDLVAKANGKAAKSMVNKARSAEAPSAHHSSSDNSGKDTSSYMEMGSKELAAVINDMSEAEQDKFYADAPEELKAKHPSLPWD